MNEMVDFQILTVKDMIKTTNLPVPDLNFPTASQMVKQKKAEKRKQIEDQLEKQKQALQIRGKVVSDYDFN